MARTTHDVEYGSNLDLILRGFNGAVNRAASIVGAGLQAIALALSTPQDNSSQVQAHIDQLTKTIKQQADAVQATVDHTKEN